MKKLRTLGALVLFGLGSALLFTPGCGSAAGDVCGPRCDCERCTDREADECDIEVNQAIDEASAYDCGDQYTAFQDCAISKAVCDNDHWRLTGSDCSGERKVYEDCVRDSSALR